MNLFYDIVKSISTILRFNKRKIFIRDFIYFIFCSFSTFLFLLAVNVGEIRYYIIIGEILGWFLYKITISNLVLIWIKTIFKYSNKFLRFIYRSLLKITPPKILKISAGLKEKLF